MNYLIDEKLRQTVIAVVAQAKLAEYNYLQINNLLKDLQSLKEEAATTQEKENAK